MRAIREYVQEGDALGYSSLVVLGSQTIRRGHQLTHVSELDILLSVDLDSLDVCLEVAVGLEDAGTLFPFELQDAGSFQYHLSFLGRSTIIEVDSVCQDETRAETQKERGANGFHGAVKGELCWRRRYCGAKGADLANEFTPQGFNVTRALRKPMAVMVKPMGDIRQEEEDFALREGLTPSFGLGLLERRAKWPACQRGGFSYGRD